MHLVVKDDNSFQSLLGSKPTPNTDMASCSFIKFQYLEHEIFSFANIKYILRSVSMHGRRAKKKKTSYMHGSFFRDTLPCMYVVIT